MSLAELIAPYVALPSAAFILWLAFGDLFSASKRALLFAEWKRAPVAQSLILLAGLSLAMFFVWIGTHGSVGSGHFGWVSAVGLIAGLAIPRKPRRA
ncbi:hypothetical protein [Achromobacter sp. MFA1 R4]|uniref:hypothetical protein n=1 Tax=Achromobacter sp. MFA1 R4 TaxID=1881016 RepID=UPI0009537802|nr:hypothetical protein [Achromobacter sp. MFA1 R4]SIT25305.1 hypothetical protein SAMN05428937_2995 [Achromobacter sp. MFA1 R4]